MGNKETKDFLIKEHVKLMARTYIEDMLIMENSLGRYFDEMTKSEISDLKNGIGERIEWIMARITPLDGDTERECL